MSTSSATPNPFSPDLRVHDSPRASVVNRTHRVVRERARVLKERRSRVRSLMVPMAICSTLLILCILTIWTGLDQYQAVEADLGTIDANNHYLVALLWFVPVSLALLSTVWVRRTRRSSDDEAR